jgi:hypothetical protein
MWLAEETRRLKKRVCWIARFCREADVLQRTRFIAASRLENLRIKINDIDDMVDQMVLLSKQWRNAVVKLFGGQGARSESPPA